MQDKSSKGHKFVAYLDKERRNEEKVASLREIENWQMQYIGDLEVEYAEMMMNKSKCEKWKWYLSELEIKSKGVIEIVEKILKNEDSMRVLEAAEALEKEQEVIDQKSVGI